MESNYHYEDGVCLPRSTIYEHYQDYCQRAQIQPVNAASFGKVWCALYSGLSVWVGMWIMYIILISLVLVDLIPLNCCLLWEKKGVFKKKWTQCLWSWKPPPPWVICCQWLNVFLILPLHISLPLTFHLPPSLLHLCVVLATLLFFITALHMLCAPFVSRNAQNRPHLYELIE